VVLLVVHQVDLTDFGLLVPFPLAVALEVLVVQEQEVRYSFETFEKTVAGFHNWVVDISDQQSFRDQVVHL